MLGVSELGHLKFAGWEDRDEDADADRVVRVFEGMEEGGDMVLFGKQPTSGL